MRNSLDLFKNILALKRGVTKYGPAPHKPILLLAVIECFEKGIINSREIEISDDLFLKFHDIWRTYVKTEHVPNFALPFFHLKNERSQFWTLVNYPGKTVPTTKSKSIKSYKSLLETVYCARLSEDIYSILMDDIRREDLKQRILKTYFNEVNQKKSIEAYTDQVKAEILYEPEKNYVRKVKRKIHELKIDSREEYVFIRSTVFRKAVIDVYETRCAITGLKSFYSNRRHLIDACHIVPFAKSYNDTISNGIALSPTLHRAFDNGFIAISDDYRVLVHPKVSDESTDFTLKQFEGEEIYLPKNSVFYPSVEKLREHRAQFQF